MIEKPKLRQVEVSPVRAEGETYLVLRDPIRISGNTLILPQAAYVVLAMLDGEHTLRDIQNEVAQQHGGLLVKDDLEELVTRLDKALMLEGPHFEEVRRRALDGFARLNIRPAAHAGTAYDGQAEALRERFGAFFREPGGPGEIGEYFEDRTDGGIRPLCGVIAPHIDPIRGSRCYAWSYKAVAEQSDADLFVVLGTAHQSTESLFVPLGMGFDTPLGPVPVDREFMAALAEQCPISAREDLLVHRAEHSVEFQVVFLRYLYEGRREITIAPVLCSSLLRFVEPGQDPMDVKAVRDFVEALRETLAGSGRKTCVVAGVDLAHLGPKFGHEYGIGKDDLSTVEEHDRHLLRCVETLNAREFYDAVALDGDLRNICGFTAIYLLMQVMEAGGATLLSYGQAEEPEVKSVVTFASMAFTRR